MPGELPLHELAACNIALGLAGFLWLGVRTTVRFKEYPDEIRMLLLLALGLFVGLVSTSIFMYTTRQVDENAVTITIVKLWAVWVLFKTRHTKYRTGEREASDEGQDQNKNLPTNDLPTQE